MGVIWYKIFEYVFSDQQGNARFSFQDNGSDAVKVIQENSFYAFGEVLANSPVSTPTVPNINIYNGGSEWQNEFNNLPDYHQTFYRNYDPAIGRFIASDPKPETSESLTAYQFAGNNPVMNNDPGGDKYTYYGNTKSQTGFGPQRLDEFQVQDMLDKYEGYLTSWDATGILEGFDDPYGGGGAGGGAGQFAGDIVYSWQRSDPGNANDHILAGFNMAGFNVSLATASTTATVTANDALAETLAAAILDLEPITKAILIAATIGIVAYDAYLFTKRVLSRIRWYL